MKRLRFSLPVRAALWLAALALALTLGRSPVLAALWRVSVALGALMVLGLLIVVLGCITLRHEDC